MPDPAGGALRLGPAASRRGFRFRAAPGRALTRVGAAPPVLVPRRPGVRDLRVDTRGPGRPPRAFGFGFATPPEVFRRLATRVATRAGKRDGTVAARQKRTHLRRRTYYVGRTGNATLNICWEWVAPSGPSGNRKTPYADRPRRRLARADRLRPSPSRRRESAIQIARSTL